MIEKDLGGWEKELPVVLLLSLSPCLSASTDHRGRACFLLSF